MMEQHVEIIIRILTENDAIGMMNMTYGEKIFGIIQISPMNVLRGKLMEI